MKTGRSKMKTGQSKNENWSIKNENWSLFFVQMDRHRTYQLSSSPSMPLQALPRKTKRSNCSSFQRENMEEEIQELRTRFIGEVILGESIRLSAVG
jgi:hypothetical protein